MMNTLLKNNRGTTAVEFALVAVPILMFTLGIVQTGCMMWTANTLHVAADVAARCGAVQSTTAPCNGRANMISTANTVFAPLNSTGVFSSNASCTTDGGSGLIGSYTVNIMFVVNFTLTAKSCYPNLS